MFKFQKPNTRLKLLTHQPNTQTAQLNPTKPQPKKEKEKRNPKQRKIAVAASSTTPATTRLGTSLCAYRLPCTCRHVCTCKMDFIEEEVPIPMKIDVFLEFGSKKNEFLIFRPSCTAAPSPATDGRHSGQRPSPQPEIGRRGEM